ncbi:hypothetical protein OP862_02445 [Yersinia massiliensis]|nr:MULTISPECIES: hypothetical protein [Yersinia]MDA5550224.1 hypothetical protein [Yersinia massiliensis]MDN0129380.1 hypothetical protein [Yersinia massiliensis]UZM79567.1 hypothetical protein OP862_02445 [Yersinia massiliensis]
MRIALAREPKDVGGLPEGQYFAQGAGVGPPPCGPTRLRRRG